MPIGIYKRKPFTEEHKRKISESNMGHLAWNKGKKCPELGRHLKGNKNPAKRSGVRKKISKANKGKVRTLEMRRKYSESKRGEKNPMYGMEREKNPNWIDGRTPKNKIARESWAYDNWRNKVFARDNWTCQKCRERGGKLHSHHILNFSDNTDLRFVVGNGITLCKGCHIEFHKIYGTKNNDVKQLIDFIKSAIIKKHKKELNSGRQMYQAGKRDERKDILKSIEEGVEKDLNNGKFYQICSNEETFKNYIKGILKRIIQGL